MKKTVKEVEEHHESLKREVTTLKEQLQQTQQQHRESNTKCHQTQRKLDELMEQLTRADTEIGEANQAILNYQEVRAGMSRSPCLHACLGMEGRASEWRCAIKHITTHC